MYNPIYNIAQNQSFAQMGVGINPWIANKVPPASKIACLGLMAV